MRFLSPKFATIRYCADYEMIIYIAVFLQVMVYEKISFSADVICCITDDYEGC